MNGNFLRGLIKPSNKNSIKAIKRKIIIDPTKFMFCGCDLCLLN